MKKKIFTLVTLALAVCSGVWGADVTVKRSIAYVAAGGTTDADHVFTGYNDGTSNIITVTADETAGSLTGTSSKTRNVTYNSKETKYSAARVFRNKNASGNDVNNDTYDDNCYVGIKLEIADGYRIDVSELKAQVGVGDDNFKYKLVVTDGTHDLYTSADKTAKKANENISTINIQSPNKLVVSGTVYLRMYFTVTNGGTSKYIQPFELSLTGDVATGQQYAITTVSSPTDAGTITGAGSYYENQDVFLTAKANAGYAFSKWTKDGNDVSTDANYSFKAGASAAEYVANFVATTTYTITGTIADGQQTYGNITNSGANTVSEDGEISFSATANEGYVFVKWQKDGADFEGNTSAAIDVTATADATYTAIFKKLFTITYDLGGYAGTTNKALHNYNVANNINEEYASADDKYTIPAYSHYYMYREGYIFSNTWEDQDGNKYQKGNEITLTKDITLTPVWTATTQTLYNSTSETIVTWNLSKSTILFNGWQNAPQVGYYTKPLTVNGELIAVPMIVDATSGKVDNSSRTDDLAQVNGGTKFTIPAIKGMKVVLTASSNITNTTVAGNTPSEGSGTKTATYNYNGEDGTAEIVINDGSYYSTIVVTYPAVTKTITPAYPKTTYVTPTILDFTGVEGLKAYVATETNSKGVKISEVTAPVPAGTPLLLIGTANTEYTVPAAASATAPAANLLVAGDGTTEFDGTTYDYILGGDGQFHQIASGKVATNKAYLHLESAPSTRSLVITFDDTTDGIDASMMDKGDMIMNKVFDLQGRRVVNPTKGLYIVGGKKMMVK